MMSIYYSLVGSATINDLFGIEWIGIKDFYALTKDAKIISTGQLPDYTNLQNLRNINPKYLEIPEDISIVDLLKSN